MGDEKGKGNGRAYTAPEAQPDATDEGVDPMSAAYNEL
jgi:hypothetical protein